MRRKRILILLLVAAIVLVGGETAKAATASTGLNVTSTVAPRCTIQGTATDVAFGAYDPTSITDNIAGQGVLTLRCVKGTIFDTYITGTRTMVSGANNLVFTLWADAGRTTTSYPSATPGVAGPAVTSNAPFQLNIYGKIAAGQDVGSGTYTAGLTIVVEY